MASAYLTRTPDNNYYLKATFSFWVKRSGLGEMGILGRKGSNSTANLSTFHFTSEDKLLINFRDSGGTSQYYIITNRQFRDTSAWYHIVYTIEGDNATQGDRGKLYVNGVRETDLALETNPSSNSYQIATFLSSDGALTVGRALRSQTDTFSNLDGSLAHVHVTTGNAYQASTFGETDSTTGIWKPKTNPSVTYGTDGFFLKFENSAAFGTDSSGNSNTFTVNGTITQTIDTPSNVFATWNSLHNHGASFEHGNTTTTTPNTGGFGGIATLGMQDGKYYMECKLISESSANESIIGVGADLEQDTLISGSYIQGQTFHFGLRNNNGQKHINGTTTNSVHGGFTTGDIMGMAFDGATKKLTFSKNGGWWNGTSTWSGTSPDFTTHYLDCSGGSYDTFFFEVGDAGSTVNVKWSCNFGNGFFGTTAVASAGTNSDIGTFEYDVPSGYKALCTKNINAQEYS